MPQIMSIGKRFEVLLEYAAKQIRKRDPSRPEKLMDAVQACLKEQNSHPVDDEEASYALGSVAVIYMLKYVEQIQTEMGGHIIEAAFVDDPKDPWAV